MAAAGLVWAAQGVAAQPANVPQNVLQLSASGTMEAQQDLLTMQLNAVREGADAATVQGQLKAVLESALAEAKKSALAGQMDVRTGNFALYPRQGRDGKLTGWTGTAELVLEGRDFGRITQTAGRIQSMAMAGVGFSLSREQRSRLETEAQAIAVQGFQAKAAELAKGFGFTGYGLREVAVNTNDQGFSPRPRMLAMEAKLASGDAPVPVEAGKSLVVVTVSGSVQLR